MLFFFSAAVGFFLSFLLVRTRKTEFAVMRSVGITRTKLFFTVFIEQLLLCAGGVGLGLAASALLWGDIMARESAIIAVCFSAGTAFSVFMSTAVNVMAAMKIKE